MDYRGASKDGTYGSKNRNQSHWLKAAWPEKRESTWPADCSRAELPGSSMSICLPLPPDSRPSLSFLFYLFLLFTFLYLLLSPLADLFISKEARRAHALAAAATFILGPCTKLIRGGESFHVNSSENAFFVMRRGNALVPNSFPPSKPWRVVRPVESNTSAGTVPSLIPQLGERTGRRETRSILSA